MTFPGLLPWKANMPEETLLKVYYIDAAYEFLFRALKNLSEIWWTFHQLILNKTVRTGYKQYDIIQGPG